MLAALMGALVLSAPAHPQDLGIPERVLERAFTSRRGCEWEGNLYLGATAGGPAPTKRRLDRQEEALRFDCQIRFGRLMVADLSPSDLEACGLRLVPEGLRSSFRESLELARRLALGPRPAPGLTRVWSGPFHDGPRRGQVCVLYKGSAGLVGSVPGPGPAESLAAYVGLVASGRAPSSASGARAARAGIGSAEILALETMLHISGRRSGDGELALPWTLDEARAPGCVKDALLTPTKKLRCVRLSPALEAALTGAAWRGAGPFDPSFGQGARADGLTDALLRRWPTPESVARAAAALDREGAHVLAGLVREAAPKPCLPGQGLALAPDLARLSLALSETAAPRVVSFLNGAHLLPLACESGRAEAGDREVSLTEEHLFGVDALAGSLMELLDDPRCDLVATGSNLASNLCLPAIEAQLIASTLLSSPSASRQDLVSSVARWCECSTDSGRAEGPLEALALISAAQWSRIEGKLAPADASITRARLRAEIEATLDSNLTPSGR